MCPIITAQQVPLLEALLPQQGSRDMLLVQLSLIVIQSATNRTGSASTRVRTGTGNMTRSLAKQSLVTGINALLMMCRRVLRRT